MFLGAALQGQHPVAQQGAWAVEITQHQIEQLRALQQTGLDYGPVVTADDIGDRVQLPAAGGNVGGLVAEIGLEGLDHRRQECRKVGGLLPAFRVRVVLLGGETDFIFMSSKSVL